MTLQRWLSKIVFATLLMGIVGACVSCRTTPIRTAESSSTAFATPSEQPEPTPSTSPVAIAFPTKQPEATPPELPSPVATSDLVQAAATETLAPTDMGEIIYFETCSGIWKIDGADGANKTLLYTDDLCKEWPELSPDSQWIAYIASEKEQTQSLSLWLTNIDKGDAWQVSAKVPAVDHAWLWDNRLLYTEYPSYVFDPYGDEPPDYGMDYRAFLYDPAKRVYTEIPAIPFSAEYYRYRFSPTEEKVAVAREEVRALFLTNLNGGEAITLVRDYPMTHFVWSPDGKHLAFASHGYREEVYVVDVHSGQIQQVTHKDENRSVDVLSWSPDGRWIAFSWWWQLCVVHVEDGEEKCFDVRPTGAMGYPIAWSPESSAIAVTHRTSQGDSWDVYSIRVADGEMNRLTHDDASEHFLLWR